MNSIDLEKKYYRQYNIHKNEYYQTAGAPWCRLCRHLHRPDEYIEDNIYDHLSARHNDRTIIIGGIRFILYLKEVSESGYVVATVMNLTNNLELKYYRSNSQGGIFRFCKMDSVNHLYKGDKDYVTQTFVHLDLQGHILRYLDDVTIKTINTELIDICDTLDARTLTEINDRLHNDNNLDLFNEIRCGGDFEHVHLLLSKIVKIYSQLHYEKLHGHGSIIMNIIMEELFYFLQQVSALTLEPVAGGKSDIIGAVSRDPVHVTAMIMIKIKALSNTSRHFSFKSKETIFHMYLHIYSNLFEKLFDKSPPKLLFETNVYLEKNKSVKLQNMKFFTVNVKYKEIYKNDQQYEISYATYKLTGVSPLYDDNTYSIVLNMVPVDKVTRTVKINKYGLYEKYMSIGAYLCKIFDYSFQVKTLFSIEGEINMSRYINPGNYIFLGDLYTGLFPANI